MGGRIFLHVNAMRNLKSFTIVVHTLIAMLTYCDTNLSFVHLQTIPNKVPNCFLSLFFRFFHTFVCLFIHQILKCFHNFLIKFDI